MMSGSSYTAMVRVEKATSDLLMSPDWAMNMDICDYVSSYPGQARDVLKAVKKRLQHKSPKVQFLALTLLETMVQNCSDFIHFQIVEKNILDDMVKIVKKKTDMNVRHKTLELLDTWQEAFGGRSGKYPQYYYACDELRRSGVQFPQRSSRAAPPIFTPPVVHPVRPQVQGYGMPSNSSRRLDEAMASESESLSMSTLESMQNVNELLNEMLQAMSPSDASSAIKDEIVVDLTARCRSNQRQLIQMLTTTEDEELLGRGLEIHEAMQSLLLRHDAIASGSLIPAIQPTSFSPRIPELRNSSPRESEKQEKSPRSSVISPTAAPAAISGKSLINEEEDDDDFAQLARRHSKSQSETAESNSSSSTSTSKALVLADPPPAPVESSRDQDMIDFLSLALTTTTPYAEEDTHPSPPITNPTGINIGQLDPYAGQVNPGNNSQQVPMQSYVVPWAQPPQSQPFQPPQPQFHQQRQFMQPPQQQLQQPPQQQLQPRHHYPANNYGYPPPPWASSGSNFNYQNLSGSSFSSRTETLYGPPTVGSVPWRASHGPNVPSSPVNGGQKPYIPPYRLFDDLNVLGNRDGAANGSGNASSSTTTLSGQSRIGGWG